MSQIEIFFSYSHKDELFKDELEKQLSSLRWQGIITIWTDRAIIPGQEWKGEISKHLDSAQIILLFISPDFMASDYCYSIEMKRAVERHDRGEAYVIPIIVRSVYWQDAPFGKLQALPKDAKPVKQWADQDEALFNVAQGIRKVVNELQTKRSDASPKASEQPIAPPNPLVVPTSEHFSQPVQETPVLTNVSNNNSSSVNSPPKLDRQEITDQEATELSSAQILQTVELKDIFTGHSGAVNSVAISPDGYTIISGSDDKKIKVWSLHTGALVRTLKGHTSWFFIPYGVTAVAISSSPNRRTIVSGGGDNTIRIWNLHSSESLRTLTGHSDLVNSVAVSLDGHTIVSGSADKTVGIWNLHSGELLRTLTGHEGYVFSVAISPDGHIIVSASNHKIVRIWNLHSGELLRTLTGHEGPVLSVAISPDGQTVVSGSNDRTVRIWNLHSGELLRTLAEHTSTVYSVAISPDGQTIVSGSGDNTIRIWNLRSGELLRTLIGHENDVNSVAISPDGQTIVSGSEDKTIRIWSI